MGFWKRRPTEGVAPAAQADDSSPLMRRFKRAVALTRKNITERIDDVTKGRREIVPEVFEQLEEVLIEADIGPRTTLEILEQARQAVDRNALASLQQLTEFIKAALVAILNQPDLENVGDASDATPHVVLVVGVNGTGKTTTIGKLAHLLKQQGLNILLCGADTFRAAANDQLAIWANRAGVPLIQQCPGADPAAVVFDSLKAAKARGSDMVIIDTAGRLHTKISLMQELEKIRRVAAREVEGAPHEVYLVIDAVTGQNGLEQARQFLQAVNVTGLVLTKIDGTAKGGIVVAIAKELRVPIRYVGLGEGLDDLVEFSPRLYVDSLFEN